MNHRLTAYLFMLLVSLIWGVAGPMIKFSLRDFPPLIFLSYRFAISSAMALVYLSVTRPRLPKSPQKLGGVLLYSLLAVSVGLGLLFFGFDKTTSLTGTLLSAMAPLATVVAGGLLLREHVTRWEQIGIGIAFAGTLLTVTSPLLGNGLVTSTSAFGSLEGNTLIIASIIVDVFAALILKTVVRGGVSPAFLTHLSFMVGLITILPIAIAVHSFPVILETIAAASLSTHLGVWYMAFLSGTLAYFLRNRAVKTIEVSEAAVFAYLYPLWAAPLSVLWLGEKITTPFLLGAATIAIGVVIAEHKHRQRRARHRHRR